MKRILSIFLSIVMLISITAGLNLTANAEVLTGNCGENGSNVTYTLDTDTGVLTISGSGKMYDYSSSSDAPWYSNASSIKTVTINSGVTSIGDRAFYDCSSLTSITIPNSVTSIGSSAFGYCSSLTSVIIPNSVTSIDEYAFKSCSSLTSIKIPNSVTSIGSSAFSGCSSITSIIIPDSVTSIGSWAFFCCSSLTSITIPDSVTSIGNFTFSYCSSLTSITIPNGVTSIGNDAFSNCSSLTSITIPNGVTSIGNYAFDGCSSLTSVTIPNSVTSIGNSAFYGCSSLTSITIPNSVTSIGNSAFRGCSSLTSITIPNSVTSIGNSAFYGCSSLTSITIPNSVTSIGNYAFYGCSSLTSITIPNSVTSIGDGAFFGCSSLKSITVDNNNQYYSSQDGVLFNKNKNTLIQYPKGNTRTSYTIPNSVTSIGDRAFYNCRSLTSVIIGNSVTSIGDEAFYECSSLTSITIPNGVTIIGNYAFFCCSSLKNVYYTGSEAQWNSISIGSYNTWLTNATIHFNSAEESGSGSDIGSETGCDFEYVENEDGTCYITDYIGQDKDIVIPEEINGMTVTGFGFHLISEDTSYSNVTSISIPKTITDIDEKAFINFTSLKTITVDTKNTEFKSDNDILYTSDGTVLICYPANKSGESFTIPITVKYVENYAFYNCCNLNTLNATHTMQYGGDEIINKVNDDLTINLMSGTELHVNAVKYNINYKVVDIYDYSGTSFGFDLKEDGYSFINNRLSFSYPEDYKLPLSSFKSVYGDKYTQQQYESEDEWGGNCYGMSVTAAMFEKDMLDSDVYGSNTVNDLYDSYDFWNEIMKLSSNSKLTTLIEEYQIWQSSVEGVAVNNEINSQVQSYAGLFLKAIDIVNKTAEPLVVLVNWKEDNIGKGHALVIDTARKPLEMENNWWRIYLYDPNYPYSNSKKSLNEAYEHCNERYVDVNVVNGQWRMSASVKTGASSVNIGYNTDGSYIDGSYIYFCSTENMTRNVDSGTATFLPSKESSQTCVNVFSNDIIISDSFGNNVFYANNGSVEYISDEAKFVQNIGYLDGEDTGLSGKVYLPKGKYTLKFDKKGKAQVLNADYFVGIVASDASQIDVDSKGNVTSSSVIGSQNSIVIERIYDDIYTSVKTDIKYDDENSIELSLDQNDHYTVTNSNEITVDVVSSKTDDKEYRIENFDGDSSSYSDIAYIAKSVGTEVSPQCKHLNITTQNAINASCISNGYTGDIVCVDCGEIVKYGESTLATGVHNYYQNTVAPTYETQGYTEYTCTVCGYSYKDNYVSKLVKPSEPTTSAPDPTPQHTQPTTTAPVQTNTQPEQTTIQTATVKKPKSTSIKKLTKGKKQFKATWKKVSGVAGYQIQYSTDKKFKKNTKTVTAKKGSTSATVKKLKSGKKYYVRVRTYKTVKGKKIYSSWSKVKLVKTK